MSKGMMLVVVFLFAASVVGAEETAQTRAISSGINEFAFDLYRQVSGAGGNVFCSPFSISTALAMTYAGARGTTAEEMAATLKFRLGQDQLHLGYANLVAAIEKECDGEKCELDTANRLWAQRGCHFLESYLNILKAHYRSSVGIVDFSEHLEAARSDINAWVRQRTRSMIRELLKPGVLSSGTRLVLVNAVYFKGYWEEGFDKSATSEAPFLTLGGKKPNVPMMHRVGDYSFFKAKEFSLLELPYRGNDMALIILLPRDPDAFREVESGLDAENLENWLKQSRRCTVSVWLPRFRIGSDIELADTLGAMGMPLAFSGQADFSGMTGEKGLAIGAVVHKAFVDINEEGSEAAASTGVEMNLTALPPAGPAEEFRADHPFVFLIRDKGAGTILFMGRLADPAGD